MGAILLDTTVLIDVLRGRPGTRERLLRLRAADDEPCACAVNVEEVLRGLRPRETPTAELLFRGLRIVPLAEAEGRQAGEWRRTYAARGPTLTQADCLVAAAAAAVGGRLATGNPKDFPMSAVDVEHWPAGE